MISLKLVNSGNVANEIGDSEQLKDIENCTQNISLVWSCSRSQLFNGSLYSLPKFAIFRSIRHNGLTILRGNPKCCHTFSSFVLIQILFR